MMILQSEVERRKGILYQVDSSLPPIGEGGMGQVFQGLCVNQHTGASRPVAIKFLFDDLPPQAMERARREASIQLRNDNLIEMLGFVEIEEVSSDGNHVKHSHVVSELLHGISLRDLLDGKTCDQTGEDIPFAVKLLQDYKNDPEHFAQFIVVGVLAGLMALHDAGYIHRDIDPSNIMLTSDGHVKLIDFGIAKQMNTLTTSDKALTVAGKFMGKPEYAAPELAIGDIDHQNQTTDIYAVGVLLYQCIVGHTPFEGARHEILTRQIHDKMPLQTIKNKGLRHIIETACQKNQELRYQSASEMRVALENPKAFDRGLTKSKKIAIGIVAAAVTILIFVGAFVIRDKQKKAEELAARASFEQRKTEFVATVSQMLKIVEKSIASANDIESPDYEQKLIKAYGQIVDTERILSDSIQYNVQMPELKLKKQEVLKKIEGASEMIRQQKKELEAFSDQSLADVIADLARRDSIITEFLVNK